MDEGGEDEGQSEYQMSPKQSHLRYGKSGWGFIRIHADRQQLSQKDICIANL
jgi:hypothetical protein